MISCSAADDRWHCSFSNGEFAGDADTTPEKGGAGAGFRPHELLEAALATCLTITAGMAAADAGIDPDDVTATVDLQRSPTESRFEYTLDFEGIAEADAERLRAAVAHCPVHETLTKTLVFEDVSESVDRSD